MSVLTFSECTTIIRLPPSAGDDEGKPVVFVLEFKVVDRWQAFNWSFF